MTKLINAVERGVIPHTIAMEIAKAKEGEVQQALAKAYEEKAMRLIRPWRSAHVGRAGSPTRAPAVPRQTWRF